MSQGNSPEAAVGAGQKSERIRILSVDDHPLLREGISTLVNNQDDMFIVGEASSGADAVERFRETRPDVTLMDVRMPGMNGIDAMIAIRKEFPDARIIMLTTSEGDVEIQRALAAGARGYILKSMPPKDLVEAIRGVHAGKKRIPPAIAAHLAEHYADEDLTAREI
ncbi:MAG TPA: response regulator transcription factor, partial [Terriglobales bacterium]